jgi:N-acetylneuraminic acid mutarotase
MHKWIPLTVLLGALLAALATRMTRPVAAGRGGADTYHETFTTTTYKDAEHTTAVWDASAGQLRLPAAPRSESVLAQLYHASAWSPAVYVTQTGHAYLFGGAGDLQGIQEYDPATNSSREAGLLPYRLQGAAAFYVPSRQSVYLLGGSSRTDIVVLDVDRMISTVLSSKLPAPRSSASAVYVPNQDRAYIFGGVLADGLPCNTILEYSLASDSVVTLPVALPISMSLSAAIYDPASESAYLFGGQMLGGSLLPSILKFDVVRQTRPEQVNELPAACSGAAAVYVPEQGKAYLFGGWGQDSVSLSQIVEFDIAANSVTPLTARLPTASAGAAAVYVPALARAYVLGGQQGPGSLLSDVVAFDVSQHTVTDLTLRLDGRSGAAGVYSPSTRKAYLFGGRAGAQAASQSILVYSVDQGTLRTLAASLPVSRTDAAAAYDPATNRAYIFGGLQPGQPTHYFTDILRLDLATERMSAARVVLPTGLAGMAAVCVPDTGKVYLFGGVGEAGCLDQILVYDPAQDSLRTLPARLPRTTAYAAGVYDAATRKVYLFGGLSVGAGGSESYFNQIVAFDAATETAAFAPVRLPQFLARAAAIAIPGEDVLYVIGGGYPGRTLGDIFRFDPMRQVLSTLQDVRLAEGRAGEAAVYVPDLLSAYLFGGTGSGLQPLLSIGALQFGHPLTATAQSLQVNGVGQEVRQAVLTAEQDLQGGSVSYGLSNDGGQTWESVQPGVPCVFPSAGSDLRWRAVLSGAGDTTPSVDSLTITYAGEETPTPTCTPTETPETTRTPTEELTPVHRVFLPMLLKGQRW